MDTPPTPQPPAEGPPPGWVPPPGWAPPQYQYGYPPPYMPPGYVMVPATAVPGPAAEAVTPPAASRPPIRPAEAPAAGALARWDIRAYASLVDISIGAGLLTAYELTLALVSPLVHVLVWLIGLFGGDYNAVIRATYWVLILAWWGWQWAQRGITGQTLGARLMGVMVVDQETRRPIGAARSLVRSVTHVVDILPLWLGFARPVWDPMNQTWADKIHKTIAIDVKAIPPPR